MTLRRHDPPTRNHRPKRLPSRALVAFGLAASIALAAAPVVAADGQLEINAACVASGCFPGDAPGYPVEITKSGSYRLTSNLTQSAVLTPLSVDTISILSANVELDLGGFSLTCLSASGVCAGSAAGITNRQTPIANRRNVRVRNGTVSGMPGTGFEILGDAAVVENVNATGNAGVGIEAGGVSTFVDSGVGARVSRVVSTRNGGPGIIVGERALVEHSISTHNGSFSITLTRLNGEASGYTGCVTDDDVFNVIDLGNNLN
ncbi:MAG: hypothetical protein AAGC67_05185 [Myxococcota bacterium]